MGHPSLSDLWRFARKFYYAFVHGVYCETWKGSMLPNLGKGKFVDVLRKGSLIDICDHGSGETIRLVPSQPHHGVMVEWFEANGNMCARSHMSFSDFRKRASMLDLEKGPINTSGNSLSRINLRFGK